MRSVILLRGSLIAAALTCSAAALAADLSQATIREKVNIVTVASNAAAAAQPASQGAVVRDENIVRTGNDSRAELQFTDLTLARLGSNSLFSFDAEARAMNFSRGAVLFSKPTNSGAVELRAGAITAAITGSTGFISNVPIGGVRRGSHSAAEPRRSTTMVGMLEGKMKGDAHWTDQQGHAQSTRFRLGPGEMLIAQPGLRPVVVQFDIPRFLKTSPLITKFSHSLLNQAELDRAVAAYRSDERRGFVEPTNVLVSSQPVQLAWTSYNSNAQHAFDASVQQLGSHDTPSGGGDFLPVGGTGVIRGQLVWDTSADLDLHLVLPDHQEVYFANSNVQFNNGRATAMLDHDNTGGHPDVGDSRVENIIVNGVPSGGTYNFFVNSFSSPNASDPFTLRVFYNGHTQLLSGDLSDGQNSQSLTVNVPPGG